ncbi:MAG: hypothetical protein NTX33_08215 [Propionibacteriales bacterium]|nr:hypothetical protein [Propionibacteriales bacterium]
MVLTRGDGSLRATIALRNVAATTYAADGAAQVVLNGLRTGHWDTTDDEAGNVPIPNWVFTNGAGTGCFGNNDADPDALDDPDEDLVLSDFFPAAKASGEGPASAYVKCAGEEGTGEEGSERIVNANNSPGWAITTLGTGGEDGVYNFNKVLKVRGGIRSNSNINANKAISVEDADVRSKTGSCTNVTVSTGYTCATNGGVDASEYDAAKYDADVASISQTCTTPQPTCWQPVPACSGGRATFSPGYYDDAAALEGLNGCNVLWFQPGTYYFDFHNSSTNGDPLFEAGIVGSTENQWTINGPKVIGGATQSGSPPTNATPIPGACRNPVDDVSAQGVQFILGGDSRISVGKDSLVELCATYRSTRPPMVLYSPRPGNTDFGGNPSPTNLTGVATGMTTNAAASATAAGTHGTFIGGTQAALQNQGNGTALWARTTTTGGNQTRTLTMSGFQPSQTVPKGSVVTGARVVVRHRNSVAAANSASLTITPTAAGASALNTYNFTPTSTSTLGDQTVSLKTALTAAQWGLFARGVHDYGYTGATIAYGAVLPAATGAIPTRSAEVDFVRLELDYYVPQLRNTAAISNNCVSTVASCAQFESDKRSEIYLQGTTFLPQGKVEIGVSNTDYQVFRWGVVARALHGNLNGAYKEEGALIELPDQSPGLGLNTTLVQFDVYVCPDSDTCDDSGKLALKVRAQIWDVDGIASTTSDREITIMSWSHQR